MHGRDCVSLTPLRRAALVFAWFRWVRQLSQITVVDRDTQTISKRTVAPLWQNDSHLIIRDESLVDGTLLATAFLVYTPEGTKVEILPDSLSESELPVVTTGKDDQTEQ